MEPLLHLIIPPLILLALFPKLNKTLIIALSPFTFLMDLDFLFNVTHRFFLHNIFFVIIATLITYLIINKQASLITLFYTLSHLILDLQRPGVAFLYPLIQKSYYISTTIIDSPFNIKIKIGSLNIQQYLTDTTNLHSYFLTTTATQLLLLILLTVILFGIMYQTKHIIRR